MTISDYISRHERGAAIAVAAAIVVYHAVAMSFGFSRRDEGFYLTFYQNIFSHPETVEYNFMYYLTGPIGGLWESLFPSWGVMGMRVLGLLFIVASSAIAYRLTRHAAGSAAALAGVLLVNIGSVPCVYGFGNIGLTVLLYTVMFALMWRGITRESLPLLLLGGAVGGINCFARVPNVLCLAAVTVIAVAASFGAISWRLARRGMAAYLAGVVAGIATVVALQWSLGHEQIFFNNVKSLLFNAAAASDEPSPHSVANLLLVQLKHYAKVGIPLLVIVLAFAGYYAFERRYKPSRVVSIAIRVVIAGAKALFLIHLRPDAIVWCIAMAGSSVMLLGGDKRERLMATMALFMLMVMPCGSDGYFNMGAWPALIAMPLAVKALWRYRLPLITSVCCLLITTAIAQYNGSHDDPAPLPQRCDTMRSPLLRGIHTQHYRAAAIDSVLSSLAGRVAAGDTMLVFSNSPMLNALTRTLPAFGNSWPGLLSQNEFEARLGAMSARTPVLVENFVGENWEHRSYPHLGEDTEKNLNTGNRKLHALDRWLIAHHYRRTLSTGYFSLYQPAE